MDQETRLHFWDVLFRLLLRNPSVPFCPLGNVVEPAVRERLGGCILVLFPKGPKYLYIGECRVSIVGIAILIWESIPP